MRFEGLADSKDPDTLAVSRHARHLARMNDSTTGLGSALGRATMPRTGLFCSALFALLPAPAAPLGVFYIRPEGLALLFRPVTSYVSLKTSYLKRLSVAKNN